MKTLMLALLLMVGMAVAGLQMDIGLGATVMTEAESDADYGWTGSVSSGLEMFGLDLGTRAMGTVYYPEHSHSAAITGAVLGEIGIPLDEEFAVVLGAGMQYGNDEARADADDEWLPVFNIGYDFALTSGHHVKPFAMWTLEAERKTVQAGFLVTFGR